MTDSLCWAPSASIDVLRQRAILIGQIRNFFTERQYLEVETPVMGHYGITDIYLSNITATCHGLTTYLQTSPEYHMKRLLAAGSGPIFQMGRVFRDDELGRWHNPEFSLLEWYQLGIDHHQLMAEVGELLQLMLNCGPLIKKTYQELFITMCGFDPFSAPLNTLQASLRDYNLDEVLPADETDRDQYLFLLMTHVIEPALAKESNPVAVYGYPTSQASLAQVFDGAASRFEVYYRGIELANGFHELTDREIQQQRFDADRVARAEKNLPAIAIDPLFLGALSAGLPPCSGVALGLDRLMMFALDKKTISEVLAFDWSRA